MELRNYQKLAVSKTYDIISKQQQQQPLIVLPTGTGKSIVIAKIVRDVIKAGGNVINLTHVKELVEQNELEIKKFAPRISTGVYCAGLNRKETNRQVIVGSVQSVVNSLDEFPKFACVIIDEAHRVPFSGEGQYNQCIEYFRKNNKKLKVIGLTATPYRMNGGYIIGKNHIFDGISYEAKIGDMIQQGYLSPITTRATKYTQQDFSNLKKSGGDFVKSAAEEIMFPEVEPQCREIIEKTQNRQSVLIFTAGVKHCKKVATVLKKLTNETVEYITGMTNDYDRENIIHRFKGHNVKVGLFREKKQPVKYLVNVNVLTTGFNAPNVDCVVLMRPTASTGLYVQMVGRGTRIAPDKADCLLLDYGGNVLRHGLIDEIEPAPKNPQNTKQKQPETSLAICPKCQNIYVKEPGNVAECPECGFILDAQKDPELAKTAFVGNVITSKITETTHKIRKTKVCVWTKKDAPDDHPKTVRIDYQTGMYAHISEWICPEHDGFARRKFENWWQSRSEAPPPTTAAECVSLIEAGHIAETTEITIREEEKKRFPEIIEYEISEIPAYKPPERLPGDEPGMEHMPIIGDVKNDDNIPF